MAPGETARRTHPYTPGPNEGLVAGNPTGKERGMTRRPWLSTFAGAALMALAPLTVRADVPPALDRAPAGAPMVIAINNIGQFVENVSATAKSLGAPPDALMGVGHMQDMLKTPGFNAGGSAAVIMSSAKDEDSEGPTVGVIPVSDFAALVKALGGEPGTGVREVKVEDKDHFIKDLGGGFAAISTDKSAVELFEGKAGGGPAIEKLMGVAGRAVAESCNAYVVSDIQAMGPKIKQGMAGMKMQMQMAMAMSGQKADLAKFDKMIDDVIRDGSAAVMGIRKSESGLKLDGALQFKEGSELAGNFNSPGHSSALTSTIPNQPFLLAAAIDTSAPVVQHAFKHIVEAGEKAEGGEGFAGMNPLKNIEKVQGVTFFMGTPPSIMNGLLLNSAAYVKTSDPAAYVANFKETVDKLKGKTIQGITYDASYEQGGAKVGEKAVDVFSLKLQVDPNNPMGDKITQMQSVFFGPGAITGYLATAPSGVVSTYGKNSGLLQQELDAISGNNGLTQDKAAKGVADNLPSDRVAEAYIGIKNILEIVTPLLGMYDFKIPDDTPPIGLAGTATGGGARFTMFAPNKVLEVIAQLNKHGDGDDEDEKKPEPKEKTGQPKF